MGGLEERYYVERLDKPEKNDGRRFFVLDPTGDRLAEDMLRRYAELTPNKELAEDILDWVGRCPIEGNRPHQPHRYINVDGWMETEVHCEGVHPYA